MHGTTVLACHRGKSVSWGHDVWPCRCFGACKWFMLFHDPELRTSIKVFGLQGPVRVREKREKERNELRDLVISFFWSDYPFNYATSTWALKEMLFGLIYWLGWKEPAYTKSNWRCWSWYVQRYRSSQNSRAG